MAIFLEIITLLIVLIVLVLVHEFGHFVVAKLSGMRVDEFGIGFPPRALTLWKKGDTEYTINWLPFGGFVRIFGEDGVIGQDASDAASTDTSRSFMSRPRILQALVLLAGITMNLIAGYVLIFASQLIGTQQLLATGQDAHAKNVVVEFTSVVPGSPAELAGLQPGDVVKNTEIKYPTEGLSYNGTNPIGVSTLIASDSTLAPLVFTIDRNGKTLTLTVEPKLKVVPGSPSRPGIGVSISEVGIIKTSLSDAPKTSAEVFWNMLSGTATGLYTLLKGIFTFKADLSQVSGPVGIATVVGQASASGFGELLSLMALISINLAIVNLIPIPALDGGRLLFVIIEAIRRKPINPKIAERVNMVGFALLLLLMVVVTAHDIFKLVH